jgi:transposase
MNEDITYVGLDVHKERIAVAIAPGNGDPVVVLPMVTNNPEVAAELVKRLGPAERLVFCYEAGPCGFGLQRRLSELGAVCMVVAPSRVPRDRKRVKTDRRDAFKLAQLLRGHAVDAVWVPDEAQEALRDLTRGRQTAQHTVHRTKQWIGKMLLRLEVRAPTGIQAWTVRYRQWLRGVQLPDPSQQFVFDEYLVQLSEAEVRLARFEKRLGEAAATSPHARLIAALQTLRGVGLLTAITLVAELGDLTRFERARHLMGYVGVTPSEASSGGRERRGPITRVGNAHARHLLGETAWHYRHAPKVGRTLRKRREGQDPAVCAIADAAQERLHRRYWRLIHRGKEAPKAATAVARELLGFIWAIGQYVAGVPERPRRPVGAAAA